MINSTGEAFDLGEVRMRKDNISRCTAKSIRRHRKLWVFSFVSVFFLMPFFSQANSTTTTITVDGSSTVFPILEAIAEEYGKTSKNTRVTVGTSGTGGGFKKFCAGETDISNSSRSIKESEIALCKKNKVDFVELPIAFDGITLVVSRGNKFLDCLTTQELKSIWEPESQISNWNQVRPSFPAKPLRLFGPGADSGTFDYFTEVINGKEDASRKDFTASEDDNVLVRGVQSSAEAMGYFGYAYYLANQKALKALKIDSGQGCVEATVESIRNRTYSPLSRPLFIYVSAKSLERPAVASFLSWTFNHSSEVVESVGYIPLPETLSKIAEKRVQSKILGSVFKGHHSLGQNLEKLFSLNK